MDENKFMSLGFRFFKMDENKFFHSYFKGDRKEMSTL